MEFILKARHDVVQLPEYKTEESAAFDIQADEAFTLKPGETKTISTGLYIKPGSGMHFPIVVGDVVVAYAREYLKISPRSGLALDHSVTVMNTPGIVETDYPNEIKIILVNHGAKLVIGRPGHRIAQGMFGLSIEDTRNALPRSAEKRTGGFGSTGI